MIILLSTQLVHLIFPSTFSQHIRNTSPVFQHSSTFPQLFPQLFPSFFPTVSQHFPNTSQTFPNSFPNISPQLVANCFPTFLFFCPHNRLDQPSPCPYRTRSGSGRWEMNTSSRAAMDSRHMWLARLLSGCLMAVFVLELVPILKGS